mmetsp:Transcript_1763/g.5281  ORF Transcript_1763/g.5281 Transcript_1763/m.5281 type:complete len:247 (-) Transcript_1763:728-1468(-)
MSQTGSACSAVTARRKRGRSSGRPSVAMVTTARWPAARSRGATGASDATTASIASARGVQPSGETRSSVSCSSAAECSRRPVTATSVHASAPRLSACASGAGLRRWTSRRAESASASRAAPAAACVSSSQRVRRTLRSAAPLSSKSSTVPSGVSIDPELSATTMRSGCALALCRSSRAKPVGMARRQPSRSASSSPSGSGLEGAEWTGDGSLYETPRDCSGDSCVAASGREGRGLALQGRRLQGRR